MRTKSICSVILCSGFCLSGCNTPPTQEQGGMVIGGILGGALGSQAGGGSGRTVATVLGTLAGSVVGGNVGRSMDDTDRLKVAHSLESVRTGVPAQWRNPDTGNLDCGPAVPFPTPAGTKSGCTQNAMSASD